MRDKQIVEQIRFFFTTAGKQGVDELDAVCFVTQAPLCRLTPTQRYIFDSILALFGNDIKQNIFVLITFADGDEPPVLNTLKKAGVPFEKEFVFNNSALFVSPDKTKNGSMFWKMGKQSFADFFAALCKTQTRSLRLTSEVLLTRRQLEVDIQSIQRQISEGTQKLCVIKTEERVLQQNHQMIADNKDFTYTVSEIRSVEVPLPRGQHTTTCIPCNSTCHENCRIPDDANKSHCLAMDGNNCKVCPQKCIWNVHKNRPYVIKQQRMEVTKTYEEAKKQYLSALEQKDKNMTVLDVLKMELSKLMKENELLVHEVSSCINRLQEIALNPTPMSEVEYIDLLIEAETDKKDDDYETRIEMFKELRKQAEALEKITKNQFEFPGPK